MDKYKCKLCSEIFTTKFSLDRHTNKKNKCNIITSHQCKKCKKYFKQKKNLMEHHTKNICNFNDSIEIYDNEDERIEKIEEIEDPIEDKVENKTNVINDEKTNNNLNDNLNDKSLDLLIKSDITIDKKIELINKYYNIEINDLLSVFNSNLSLEAKIKIIYDFKEKVVVEKSNINYINNGIIQTTNNTTHNIQINNFGSEKLEYLDNEYFKDLIMNNHIQTAYMKLIEDTYLHKDHPDNHTIKITNLDSKYGFVFENNKWRPIVKYELKELMHEKNNKLLKIHYKRLKQFLNAAKKSSINVFFSRQYDSDPQLKLMNDQMVILFYEGKKKK